MSAYVVAFHHVNALLNAAVFGPRNDCERMWDRLSFYTVPHRDLADLPVADYQKHEVLLPNGPDVLSAARKVDRSDTLKVIDRVGELMLRENRRSVGYRYDERWDSDSLPGYSGQPPSAFWFDPIDRELRLTTAETLKALDGFRYQCCEHREWTDSAAFAFCAELERRVVRHSEAYLDASTWAIETPDYASELRDTVQTTNAA